MWDGNRLLQERRSSQNTKTQHVTTTVYEPESFGPLAQLAWTEHAAQQTQIARPSIAKRTGTHDEIIGGLDQALADVKGYSANDSNRLDYKNNSE